MASDFWFPMTNAEYLAPAGVVSFHGVGQHGSTGDLRWYRISYLRTPC